MDADAFGTAIMENLLAGVDEYTQRMAERMRRKAPVSKEKLAGPRTKTYRVKARSLSSRSPTAYLPFNRSDRERQQLLLDVRARERVGRKPADLASGEVHAGKGRRYRSTGMRVADIARTSETKRFVFAEGPLKGQSPDELRVTSRGALRGVAHHRGGKLRDSIHYVPAHLEGGQVIGSVAADAEYAKYVEYGFIHHGSTGRRVKAQPFFRPIWKENQVAGAARLARYVKKAGR